MDWIDINSQQPEIGVIIWGRDKTGWARLGVYAVHPKTKERSLKSNGAVLIKPLEKWATYDVIY